MCRLGFSFNVSETDLAGNLFVCNEGLFWFSESCLNYIMFELYSYVSLKTRAKKTNKKNNIFTVIARFPNTAPSTTSASLSLSLPNSLSDLLSLSHPLLPHTSHLSLLHSERPIWESVSAVPVRMWLALLHISVSLTPYPSSTLLFWLEVR